MPEQWTVKLQFPGSTPIVEVFTDHAAARELYERGLRGPWQIVEITGPGYGVAAWRKAVGKRSRRRHAR